MLVGGGEVNAHALWEKRMSEMVFWGNGITWVGIQTVIVHFTVISLEVTAH